MLNFEEREKILHFLRYCYRLNLCPTEVDTQAWKLRPGMRTRRKAFICSASYGFFLLHVLYKVLSLVHSVLILTGIPLPQILIHAMIAVVGLMAAFFHWVIHLKFAHVNTSFVRITLTGSLTGEQSIAGSQAGNDLSWLLRLREHSVQDLIAIYLPHITITTAAVIGGCYLYDPSMKILLYSALAEKYQNWLSYGICFVEEIRFLARLLGTVVTAWQIQLLAFELVTNELDASVQSLKTQL